jgi:low temperature requirement protein LtrA
MSGLLRIRAGHGSAPVTNIELFFDLVFVFAVTQLSHALLHELNAAGAVRTLLLFLAVWWVWIFTAWVTNWLDPERWAVRVALLVLMLAGLGLSIAIPHAFEGTGLLFAGAYVAMQLGRSLFTLWAIGGASPGNTRNFQRISLWFVLSALPWLAGGLAEGEARLALWAVAVALDYLAPALGFAVPGLGRSTTRDWDVDGRHMAERCSLFVIIALGESVLATGANVGAAWIGTVGLAAFVAGFLGNVAQWWLYFDTGAERGSAHIAGAADPGRLARAAYTYTHLLIVGGIIVSAVADDLLLRHPSADPGAAGRAAILGGPALYLAGNLLFKARIAGRPPLSHMVGLALLALALPFAPALDTLALSAAAVLAQLVAAGWESVSLRRR